MCVAFEPVTATEESRRLLRNLCQTGRVHAYVQHFCELQYRLPGMSEEEAFSTFLAGLAPHIQEQVGAHIQGDLVCRHHHGGTFGRFLCQCARKVVEAVAETQQERAAGVDRQGKRRG